MRRLFWLAVLLLGAVPARGAEPLSIGAYREAITALEAALDRGDLGAARGGAQQLAGALVVLPDGGTLTADPTLFAPLAEADSLATARQLAPRLGALRRALAGLEIEPALAIDRELLARLSAAEAERRPTGEGFEIGAEGSMLQALGDLLRPVRDFLVKVWTEFWEWFADLFRRQSAEGGWLSGISLPSLVTVLVIAFAVALALLAVRSWRGRRKAAQAPAGLPGPLDPADEDPLSRDEGGWRRYASELAAGGRTREAIRAWYHAVLVALYGRGLVSYRKGRTNWELVAALSPALAFRPAFIDFTRLFDREWYGLRQSPPEALTEAEELAEDLLGAIEPSGGAR